MFSINSFQNEKKTGSTRFFPTTYLDSPILTTPYDCFVQSRKNYLSTEPLKNNRSAEAIFQEKITEVQKALGFEPYVPELVVPQQYPDILFQACAPTETCQIEMDLAREAADPVTAAANRAYAKLAGLPFCSTLPENNSHFEPYLREYSQMRFFEEFIVRYHGERAQGGKKGKPVQEVQAWGISAITDGSLWFFSRLPGVVGPALMTHDQLLMLKDALYARFNVLVAHEVIYKDTPFQELIRSVWSWQEECLTRYGNEGYEIAKSTESLSKTYMSRVAGCTLPQDNDSFSNMIKKVSDKEAAEITRRNKLNPNSVSTEPIMALKFASLLEPYKQFYTIVEVFGLQKCTGHPMIDPERGGISAAKEAKEPDETLYEDARSLRNSWMRIFIESFVNKHGRYPEFTRNPEIGTELHRLWRLNQLNLHRTSYPLADLNKVVLAQHFTFDYYEDYLQLLDDKAISFQRTERHLFWDRNTGSQPSTSVRLILEMMARPEISPQKIVQAVEDGRIPLEWLIVSITPKEREFKLNPRMFAMFVLEMRHFFAMHEANLAVTILPYLPQLTMTDSRLDIQDRFLNLTKIPDTDDRKTLLLEFDLSRWNLRWRKLCINSIGKDLNDLFGMDNVFTAGHTFFSESLISVRVPGLRPPDVEKTFPEDSLLEWNHHLGGFEGILQKLWSIATVAMMDRGLADLPLAYTWTIQGDNVTAVVTLPPAPPGVSTEDHLTHWQAIILKRAEETTSSVNQDLKGEECVASTRVLTYSKDIYSCAVEFFTTLKFFSRIFPTTADDFPGVASQLSALYSGCLAASERTKNSPIGFFLALSHGALYLARLLRYDRCYTIGLSKGQKRVLMSPNFIRYALLLPAELGGLATLSMADYLYKGGSDPLAKALTTIHLLRESTPSALRIYYESFTESNYESKPTIQALIKDPKGVPIKKPVAPADSVANGARDVLRMKAVNPHIKDVMSVEIEEWDKKLCEHLGRVTPLAVDLLHDLRASSVAGRAEALSRTFTATRSLQAMAKTYSEVDLVQTVIAQARKQISSMIKKFSDKRPPSSIPPLKSLHCWVKELRDNTWGKAGYRPQGVDSHLPFDFVVSFGKKQVESEISLMAQYPRGVNTSYVRGPYPPMKGSKTREAKSSQGYTVVATNSSASAVKDQQRIKAFAQGNEKMEALIDVVALTRTDVNLSALGTLMLQKDGGNNVHRYNSLMGSDSAYVLGQGNNCTYTTICSDNIKGVSASARDFAFMVQEHMVYLQALAALRRLESGLLTEYDRISLHVSSDQLTELPDDSLILEGDLDLQPVSLYSNPLVYVPEILVKKISGPTITPAFPLDLCESVGLPLALAALKSVCHKMLGQLSELTGAGGIIIRRSENVIDILELKSLGLSHVLDTFALVLAERIILTLAQNWSRDRLRVVACLICLKQGPTLIASILKYIRHPTLRNDVTVKELNICAGPVYQGRRIDESRMLARVTRKVIALLTDNTSPLYERSTIFFTSDHMNCISRELELMAYLAVMASNIEGELPKDEVEGTLNGLRSNMALFPHNDEKIRQSRLHTLFLLWAEGIKETYPICSSRFRRLARKPSIYLSQLTSVRALRAARQLTLRPIPVSRAESSILSIHTPGKPHLPTHSSEIIRGPNGREIASWGSSLWGSVSDRCRKDLAYNRGCEVVYGSTALAAWWPMRFLFEERHVIVIGSGNGAVASVAILGGARSVGGLDLRNDLPKEESMTEDYVPPLVRQFADPSKYVQLMESFTTSGDWFATRVYSELIPTIPSLSLVVIDIQGEIGYSPAAIRPLLALGWTGDVMLRWQGGRDSLYSVVGTLLSVGTNMTLYQLRSFETHTDIVIFFTLLRKRNLIPGIVSSLSPIMIRTPLPPFFSDRKWAFDVLFSPIGGPVAYRTLIAASTALDVIDQLAGEYTTRPNYASWTRILHVGIASQWLLRDDEHIESDLLTIIQSEEVSLVLKSLSLAVTVTPSLIRTLTHLASHLIRR